MNNGLSFKISLWIIGLGAAALALHRRREAPVLAGPRLGRRRRPTPLPRPRGIGWAPLRPPAPLPQPAPLRRLARGEPEPSIDGDQKDRGRAAATPSDIPARGWKDILRRVYANISEHRLLAIAAGATFYGLLAIFPAIAALVAIYSLFADPMTIRSDLDRLYGVLPGGAISVIGDQVTRVAAQGGATLGLATVIGVLVSLWSANAGAKAVFDALNIVYREREKRGFLKLNAISLTFTIAGVALAILAVIAVVALPPLLARLGLPAQIERWIDALRWPALVIVLSLAVSLVYRYGPSRDAAQWRWLTWGGAFFAIGWLIVSLLFSWYASNFGSFNKTYGSLGAVIGFMVWIWISNIVLLIGAELNAEMEHQTARDTTRGAPKPLGTRGASMADTIGPATD